MKLAALLLFAVGCRSEGGVEFSYGLYRDTNPPTAASDCTALMVQSVRLEVGNDANNDGLLQDEETAGRAVVTCNQRDRDADGVLAPAENGVYRTESDRLPAGEYSLFSISLAPSPDATKQIKYFTDMTFADKYTFSVNDPLEPAVVITENAITRISFAAYAGNFPELRLIVR